MYKTIEDTVGNTPLVRLKRMPGETSNIVLVKLERNNPAGSVKDRPALSMIERAEARGEIKPGDRGRCRGQTPRPRASHSAGSRPAPPAPACAAPPRPRPRFRHPGGPGCARR